MNAVLHGCKVARVLRYVVRYDVCVTHWEWRARVMNEN